jgi:UPF0042 nucleotide-binding protein
MRLIIVSGLSGSGKSVAIRQLEDLGYYCIDNLPAPLLLQACEVLAASGHGEVAVSIDARTEASPADLPGALQALRAQGHDAQAFFLTASDTAIVQRFSETRRRHPLSQVAGAEDIDSATTLEEAIGREREMLAPLQAIAHPIDTSGLPASTLRQWVREFVGRPHATFTLTFESFAFKHGIPVAADFVFDVRNLPNPHYERELRALTGLDAPVIEFLEHAASAKALVADIGGFLERWLPGYAQDGRQYLTVSIGCTGGQHRSPWVVERLAARFGGKGRVLVRHRALQR